MSSGTLNISIRRYRNIFTGDRSMGRTGSDKSEKKDERSEASIPKYPYVSVALALKKHISLERFHAN